MGLPISGDDKINSAAKVCDKKYITSAAHVLPTAEVEMGKTALLQGQSVPDAHNDWEVQKLETLLKQSLGGRE